MSRQYGKLGLALTIALITCGSALGEESPRPLVWSWEWKAAPEETKAPKVEICSLKYDKEWAYAFEIDDGPTTSLTVCQPLLARFAYTDAPPGMSGGQARPFVGSAAVMVQWVGTSNDTHLNWDQLRELERLGWGIVNHSYWHTGNHWDPAQALKPADFRRELYWSQTLLAANLWNGQSGLQFVYPNGDFHYEPYLSEFGIRSATRVGGRYKTLKAEASAFLDIDRNHLDESVWAGSNDPLIGFPQGGPKPGDLVIDFTHAIEPSPESKNHRRWVERLTSIATKYGRPGLDTLWCAPTGEIVRYTLAARQARIEATRGRVELTLPPGAPGSALTFRLSGLSERSTLQAPPGGSLHRQGDRAWITTPLLASSDSPALKPSLELIYQGPVKTVTFDHPRPIAGVRLMQSGRSGQVKIGLVNAEGQVQPLASGDQTRAAERWGTWLLFSTVPDRPAILTREVQVTPDPALKSMEIWASIN